MLSGKYRKQEAGRQYVLLRYACQKSPINNPIILKRDLLMEAYRSLAEAETIRCILHLRQGQAPIQGCDTALALRCVGQDIMLDKSDNFVDARCVCVCVYACVRACVCACVCVCRLTTSSTPAPTSGV